MYELEIDTNTNQYRKFLKNIALFRIYAFTKTQKLAIYLFAGFFILNVLGFIKNKNDGNLFMMFFSFNILFIYFLIGFFYWKTYRIHLKESQRSKKYKMKFDEFGIYFDFNGATSSINWYFFEKFQTHKTELYLFPQNKTIDPVVVSSLFMDEKIFQELKILVEKNIGSE